MQCLFTRFYEQLKVYTNTNSKFTLPPPELYKLPPGNPSVTGEQDDITLRGRHDDLGAEPLVFRQVKVLFFFQLDQEGAPQRRGAGDSVAACLTYKMDNCH